VALPRNDNWLQAMSTRVNQDLQAIQRGVFDEVFQENSWLPGYFLSRAAARRNALIIPEDESSVKFIDVSKLDREDKYIYDAVPRLPFSETASKADWAHLMVIADVDSAEGSNLVLEAVKFGEEHRGVEIIIVHNPAASSPSSHVSINLSELIVETGGST
jgi:UDP-glucose:glycoprotein glucosyltransferase